MGLFDCDFKVFGKKIDGISWDHSRLLRNLKVSPHLTEIGSYDFFQSLLDLTVGSELRTAIFIQNLAQNRKKLEIQKFQ